MMIKVFIQENTKQRQNRK